MKTVRDIGLLFQRMLVQLLRNPVWLVVGFSTPILYLALFTPLLRQLASRRRRTAARVRDRYTAGIETFFTYQEGRPPRTMAPGP